MATPAAMMTLLECHMSSTQMGWTAMSWRRNRAPLAFLDGVECCLLNAHEANAPSIAMCRVICNVEARVVEVDLPVGQHHLEELDLEHSLVVWERVVCSWKLGHKLVQMV
jgi:hypothetical protein